MAALVSVRRPVRRSRLTRACAITAALSLILTVPAVAPAAAQEDENVIRVGGANRIQTAALAATTFWDSSEHAVIATAGDYPDALASWPVAARLGAPLLLTSRTTLSAPTAQALIDLGVSEVTLLGGTAAIDTTVENALVAAGYTVNRLAGADRFATARQAALAAGPSDTGEVLLALGRHADPARGWPDATASGAFAALADPPPLLLTFGDRLPAQTITGLEELGAQTVIIIGGAAAVSEAVEEELFERGYGVDRLWGASRYETSTAVVSEILSRLPLESRPLIASSGGNFPDALTAGPLAARLGAPVHLVFPDHLNRSLALRLFFRSLRGLIDRVIITGGPAAVSTQSEAHLARDLDLDGAADPTPISDPPAIFEPETETVLTGGFHTFEQITIPPGVIVTIAGPSLLQVDGDTSIHGALLARGNMTLQTTGDLTITGTVHTPAVTEEEAGSFVAGSSLPVIQDADDIPVRDLPGALVLVVGGAATLQSSTTIHADGPLVITDDEAETMRTTGDIREETNSASGDLATIAFLHPDDPAFGEPEAATAPAPGGGRITQDDPPQHQVSGTWTSSGALMGFNQENDGASASGWRHRGALSLWDDFPGGAPGASTLLSNRGGPISFVGSNTITGAPGRDGADDTVECGDAVGGDGGDPGGVRIIATAIEIPAGSATFIPSLGGGDGGTAVAVGVDGCDVSATGGTGASHEVRLFTRGSVSGVAGVIIGRVRGGNGGRAEANGGRGAPGDPCEDGEEGGNAVATGGDGGNASLDVGFLPASSRGVLGGHGGQGFVRGGAGGNGGDCETGGKGGDGGKGGKAEATGGGGGAATGPDAIDGFAGQAVARGGKGGDGGNACGPPHKEGGQGGDGGEATAVGGTGRGIPFPTVGQGGDGGDGGDGTPEGDGGEGGTGINVSNGDDGSPGGSCPEPAQHTLTVEIEPDGGGMVGSDPGNISCPPLCNDEFDDGTTVTLTAAAFSGYVFESWSGDCSGAAVTTVVMDGDKACTATFAQPVRPPVEDAAFHSVNGQYLEGVNLVLYLVGPPGEGSSSAESSEAVLIAGKGVAIVVDPWTGEELARYPLEDPFGRETAAGADGGDVEARSLENTALYDAIMLPGMGGVADHWILFSGELLWLCPYHADTSPAGDCDVVFFDIFGPPPFRDASLIGGNPLNGAIVVDSSGEDSTVWRTVFVDGAWEFEDMLGLDADVDAASPRAQSNPLPPNFESAVSNPVGDRLLAVGDGEGSGASGVLRFIDLTGEEPVGTTVGDLGGDNPRRIRWDPVSGIGAVSDFANNLLTIFTWDGENLPVITDVTDADSIAQGPVGIDVHPAPGGGAWIISTGFNDNQVTFIRVDADGEITSAATSALPEECENPGHGAWAPSVGAPDAFFASCWGSAGFVIGPGPE